MVGIPLKIGGDTLRNRHCTHLGWRVDEHQSRAVAAYGVDEVRQNLTVACIRRDGQVRKTAERERLREVCLGFCVWR